MKIPSSVRLLNKKYINKVMLKFAGRKHSFIVLMRHQGRKSGNIYSTPILAAKLADRFVFALTYGKDVDWYRNVLAHGESDLLWHGTWFSLTNPVSVSAIPGRKAFAQPWRAILSLVRIEDFFEMKVD